MWHFKPCSSAFGWQIFVFASPTVMSRGCAGPWCLPGTSSSLLCSPEPSSVPWSCCPKLQSTPWCLHGQGKAPLPPDSPGSGRALALVSQACPPGLAPGLSLGDDSRHWQGQAENGAAAEFKIKSVYWISAVGALHYRSDVMILSQLFLELHIANAKRWQLSKTLLLMLCAARVAAGRAAHLLFPRKAIQKWSVCFFLRGFWLNSLISLAVKVVLSKIGLNCCSFCVLD